MALRSAGYAAWLPRLPTCFALAATHLCALAPTSPHPSAGARCQLGNKYGAEVHEWEALLLAARSLGVEVAGVAFHVGSGGFLCGKARA